MPVKVGLLALQGAIGPHAEVLRALGAAPVEVRTPEQLAGVDALIIPGGESTTMSKLLDTSGLADPLGVRLRAGLPTFGTCAGMILLARTVLDGRPDQHSYDAIDVTVRRNAFGRQVDSFEAELDVDGLDGAFPAVFIRAPFVEEAGDGVEVLAAVDGHPVLCRQGPVLASAFHPELTGDHRLHQLFLTLVS
ncbi:MAG: pyridoxal 5'-phosphate synthase glutaminase subunit PdxT [Acidimicrobiia bacterium]|nr:pyridoxal 5'-phosphate synthase glutaminase subunit PdxT [Acidimicrobiia bacterium]